MNPAPADPVQAKMFTFMPVIFTFMFATFRGAGDLLRLDNILSVAQQYLIMRSDGVKVHLFENLKLAKPKPAPKPLRLTMADETEAARILFAGPCDFVWGAKAADNLPPEGLPEVAFVGRSNAGKSSLINALTGRKTLARVSQTPGATRQLNFFKLGDKLTLVDLPGYGFAKRSKAEAASWQDLIFTYLRRRARLRRVALLIDARRGVMEADEDVMGLLDKAAVSYGLVLTKIDEVAAKDRGPALEAARAAAAKHTAALADVLATSALDMEGIPALRTRLAEIAKF